MGKSSSSVKKKRSMVSSPARKRKISKSRTRRSKKSKKLRDSVSYSSDSDDSMSSVSVSYSSSEDDYKSKRSRSRVRKDVKGRNKSARRRSSSYESIEDSRPVKKQKGSKKTDDVKARKKSDKKRRKKNKKSKREASVSAVSSRSWSCSTRQGESSGSDEGEVEMDRSRLDRKGRDKKKRLEKVKSGSKLRRSRSRSRSSRSYNRSSGYRSEEKLTVEVNPRRLKSVITVLREDNEDRGMDKDENKEEMIYDYDDCPPCRSNDSNDGVSKKDLVQNLHVASEKKRHIEDEEREEAFNSDMRTSIAAKNDKDSEGQYNRSNSGCYGVGEIQNDAVEDTKNDDSSGVGDPSCYDLESILRQKALENLRTFKKGNQPDAKAPVDHKDPNECDVKSPSTTKAEFYQHRSPKGGDARVMGASQVREQNSTPEVSKSVPDFAHEKISGMNDVSKRSESTKDNVVHPLGPVALASNPNENVSGTVRSVSSKPRLVSLSSRQESPNTCTNKKHVSELQEPPQPKSATANCMDNSMVETARTAIPQTGSDNVGGANNTTASDDPASCPKSLSGGVSSSGLQDQAKEDSQFQQRTMSVMRGGEMVEVSYKVYIPKKAPALARRQLRR